MIICLCERRLINGTSVSWHIKQFDIRLNKAFTFIRRSYIASRLWWQQQAICLKLTTFSSGKIFHGFFVPHLLISMFFFCRLRNVAPYFGSSILFYCMNHLRNRNGHCFTFIVWLLACCMDVHVEYFCCLLHFATSPCFMCKLSENWTWLIGWLLLQVPIGYLIYINSFELLLSS